MEKLEKYTGFKKSYSYHLLHYSKIPYSKPHSKYFFFQKSEIDKWLLKNKSLSDDQIQEKAREYALKKGIFRLFSEGSSVEGESYWSLMVKDYKECSASQIYI